MRSPRCPLAVLQSVDTPHDATRGGFGAFDRPPELAVEVVRLLQAAQPVRALPVLVGSTPKSKKKTPDWGTSFCLRSRGRWEGYANELVVYEFGWMAQNQCLQFIRLGVARYQRVLLVWK